ncbi:unnamed protein product [Alopecurus aequalis]
MMMTAMDTGGRLGLSYSIAAALLFLFNVLLSAPRTAPQPLPWPRCGANVRNYTEGSAYQANLRVLASRFPKDASASPDLFTKGAVGTAHAVVYALALCRGDTNAENCLKGPNLPSSDQPPGVGLLLGAPPESLLLLQGPTILRPHPVVQPFMGLLDPLPKSLLPAPGLPPRSASSSLFSALIAFLRRRFFSSSERLLALSTRRGRVVDPGGGRPKLGLGPLLALPLGRLGDTQLLRRPLRLPPGPSLGLWEHWTSGTVEELLDPSLGGRSPGGEMLKLVNIGLLCVQDNPADRPTMSTVNVMLGNSTVSLQAPARPTFCVGDMEGLSDMYSEAYPSGTHSRSNRNSKTNAVSPNELTLTKLEPR